MSISSKALRLAEASHSLDEMAAIAAGSGVPQRVVQRVLEQADGFMDRAMAEPLEDEVRS